MICHISLSFRVRVLQNIGWLYGGFERQVETKRRCHIVRDTSGTYPTCIVLSNLTTIEETRPWCIQGGAGRPVICSGGLYNGMRNQFMTDSHMPVSCMKKNHRVNSQQHHLLGFNFWVWGDAPFLINPEIRNATGTGVLEPWSLRTLFEPVLLGFQSG